MQYRKAVVSQAGLLTLVYSLLCALTISPTAWAKGVPAYVQQGNKLEAERAHGKALIVYDAAYKQNPNDLYALWRRIVCCTVIDGMQVPVADCEKLVSADPQCKRFPSLYYYRALAYLDADEPEKALKDTEKTKAMEPENYGNYICRAKCYMQLSDYQNAISTFSFAIDHFKCNQPYPVELRAKCYECLNQPEKALVDWTRAIELDRGDANFYVGRARVLERLHKYEAAIADYTYLVKTHPKDETLLYQRAKVYFAWGKYKEALTDLNKSIEMDPVPSATIYELRAKVHDKLGQSQEAKKDRESASKVRI